MSPDLLLLFYGYGLLGGWDAAEQAGCEVVDQALEDYAHAQQRAYQRGRLDERLATEPAAAAAAAHARAAALCALFPEAGADPAAFADRIERLQRQHRDREGGGR